MKRKKIYNDIKAIFGLMIHIRYKCVYPVQDRLKPYTTRSRSALRATMERFAQ